MKRKYEHHGMKGTPEYNLWRNIKDRTRNKNHPRFNDYGGRGIKMCDAWYDSFSAFFEYVGKKPDSLTLDRIDNDGNYEPGNVRWATTEQQTRNSRNRKDSTSSIRGVSFNKTSKKYQAYIFTNGRQLHIGFFERFIDAVNARKAKELEVWNG